MNNVLTIHAEGKPIYNIVFQTTFDKLSEQLRTLHTENRRICIVTETTVASYYLSQVQSILASCAKQVIVFTFPAGESNKNLNTVNKIYKKLIENKFDRKDLLVALGGGVVGDLTGFAAATYLRGIDFIQIPTSLLAQVDSSIGGKTGVDYESYKNMVGAFHQPKLVYINIAVLSTLSEREFNSGMGEIIKHGLIKDKEYYKWLNEKKEKILHHEDDVLLSMIYRSCQIKGEVVEKDPKEEGERALLNFGHTIGHSIEKLMNFKLLHGECVAIGCMFAGLLSKKRQKITQKEFTDMKALFDYFEFPVLSKSLDADEIIAATKLDKKMESGIIKFILLNKIGEAYIDRTVSDQEMKDAIQEYFAKQSQC